MSPETLLQDCDRALQELLPDQTRPVQKALAALLCGVVRARSVVLSRLGLPMPGRTTALSKQRHAQRLLANAHLHVPRAQQRLLARVLGARRGRVDLLLDAVVRGASAHRAGTVSLVLAVAWHRRALPLIWRTWRADQSGQEWHTAIREVVAAVQAALPTESQVVVLVLVDRGLSNSHLARMVLARGTNWHFLWRVIRTTRLHLPDGTIRAIGELVPRPGCHTHLNGARLYAPRHKAGPGAGGWRSDWTQALAANVVAVWRPRDREPWLLISDLPTCAARCGEYRRRTWEEIVYTQMTKTDVLTGGRRGDDVADLDLPVSDDDPINEQLDEVALLLKGGLGQPSLYPLTQGVH